MRLVVGRVGRAHGLAGEVTVEVRTDEPELRFAAGAVLDTDRGPLVVQSSHWHSGRLLVRFAQAADRTAAEGLRGTELWVDVDESALPDDPDAFYDHQLVGLRAELADATVLGEVTEVVHLPAQDLLAVTTPDGREVLVPFVSAIVTDVYLAARRVVVDPPGGLFDADEA